MSASVVIAREDSSAHLSADYIHYIQALSERGDCRTPEGQSPALIPAQGKYVFSVVGTSRCDVRAACSGATPSNASVAGLFDPPAATRAGTARRAIPTIALNTYQIG